VTRILSTFENTDKSRKYSPAKSGSYANDERHTVLKSDVYPSGSNFNARILPQVCEADSAFEQMRAYPKKSALVRYS